MVCTLNEEGGAVSGRTCEVPGRASVDATVLTSEALEDEQTVKLARLRLDVQVTADRLAVPHPAHLDGQIAGRNRARHLRPTAVLHLSGKAKRLNHWRTCKIF